MRYRRFGKTGLRMSVLTCGGMRFQQSWDDKPWERIAPSAQENLEACVRRAFDLGINHFETARGYGTSELQLGRILPRLPRDELIVQTKVSPVADPAEFVGKFETSLDHLGLETVDLFALHGINNRTILEWSMREGGCLDAARRLQAAGRCRFLGFSTHGPPDVILEAIRSDAFDYVNLHWYFVNDFNWPAIVKRRGVSTSKNCSATQPIPASFKHTDSLNTIRPTMNMPSSCFIRLLPMAQQNAGRI